MGFFHNVVQILCEYLSSVMEFSRYLNTSIPWCNWIPPFRDLYQKLSEYVCSIVQFRWYLHTSVPWYNWILLFRDVIEPLSEYLCSVTYSNRYLNTYVPSRNSSVVYCVITRYVLYRCKTTRIREETFITELHWTGTAF